MSKKLTHLHDESGHCRKYYKCINSGTLYCLQLENRSTAQWFYANNDIGEPEHPVDGTTWTDEQGNLIEYSDNIKTVYECI